MDDDDDERSEPYDTEWNMNNINNLNIGWLSGWLVGSFGSLVGWMADWMAGVERNVSEIYCLAWNIIINFW